MKLYNEEVPSKSNKAKVNGCLTVLLIIIIIIGLPHFGIWLLNLSRTGSGQDALPYDLSNWSVAFLIMALVVTIKIYVGRIRTKNKKK